MPASTRQMVSSLIWVSVQPNWNRRSAAFPFAAMVLWICGCRGQGRDASDIVNELDEAELADIIWRFGEERASRRIAKAIVRARLDARIERTRQLADIIHSVMPRPKPGQTDSATRTFQALRIHINGELDELETALADCEKLLALRTDTGDCRFHSLEDRIVKNFLI